MCGRYTLAASAQDLAERFLLDLDQLDARYQPRYNIAPSQQVLALTAVGGHRDIRWLRWGLTPSWSRDGATGPINARCESVFERPTFRRAIRQRRCLVPADGFFEWAGKPPHRTPHHFSLASGQLFALAGIWEQWQGTSAAPLESLCLLTTTPNAMVAPIHDRMPVILRPDQEDIWLNPTLTEPADLAGLFAPYDAKEMRMHMVSTAVNDPGLDTPACVWPLAAPGSD